MLMVFTYEDYEDGGGLDDLLWVGENIDIFNNDLKTTKIRNSLQTNIEAFDTTTLDIYKLTPDESGDGYILVKTGYVSNGYHRVYI